MTLSKRGDTPDNPLPINTTKPEPKVVNATISAGAAVGVVVMLAQLLYSRADLIAFLPDALEAPVLAILTAIVTYGAGYASKHQFRAVRSAPTTGYSAQA